MKIVRVVGQLEFHQINNRAVKQGFRIENGRLVKYTIDGRKRNNWINHYRHISKKHLKDNCERRRCGFAISKKNYLTIHHKIPLSSAKSEEELKILCKEENCQTLCQNCHTELEQRRALKRNGKVKKKKKVKKVIVSEEKSLLILENGLWGEYRISRSNFPFC